MTAEIDSINVERVSADRLASLARQLEEGKAPLVIEGGVSAWPAVSRWTSEYLAEHIGHVDVQYKVSSGNAHPDFRQPSLPHMFTRGRAPFRDFLRLIGDGPLEARARYLFTGDEQFLVRRRAGVSHINPELAPLLDDVTPLDLFDPERLYTVWAWFSGPGVRTWLHYDNNGCHNLNAQVTGHKQCWLYPPEALPRLHPFVLGGPNPAHNCSAIDAEQPQSEFAEDFRATTAYHAELRAGDLLFIPAWWFHTFAHHGELNCNVNFWWRPERSTWNVVAARQALLDAAAEAQLDRSDEQVKRTLSALDAALLQRVG